MDTEDSNPKRRRLTLNPDELEFWKDLVKGVNPNCMLLTEGSRGCAQLSTENADDVIRELRKRVKR